LTGNFVSVRDYLRLVFRRKHALLIPFLISILAVGPIWILAPITYRAEAIVKRQDLGMAERAGASSTSPSAASPRTLYIEIVTPNNLDRVIRQLKMDVNLKTPADWQRKYDELRRNITIAYKARSKGLDLIEIAAVADTPRLAMDIANAVADNYVEESKRSSREAPEMAIDYLDRRAAEALRDLKAVEAKLDKYKREYLQELPQVKDALLRRIFDLETQQASASILLEGLQKRLELIEKQIAETPPTVTSEVVTEANPEYASREAELSELRRARDRMLTVGGRTPEHPEVVKLGSEIARLEKELAETPQFKTGSERQVQNPALLALQQEHQRTQQDIQVQLAQIDRIKADIVALQLQARKMVQEEQSYADLLREKERCESQYHMFMRNLEAAQTQYDVETSKFGVQVDMIQRAIEPAAPYRVPRVKMALSCLGAGLVVGIVLMFALEFCDHSLRGREDAASFLQVPVLGCVSLIEAPSAIARRRRRSIVLALVAVAVLIAGVCAVVAIERLRPGALERLAETARAYLA